MKKFLIRSAVFVLTFVITLLVASRILNKNHDNLTMDVPRASLPVITMLWDGKEYNPLYGHVSAMDPAAQRDQITILGEGRKTSFKIRTHGRNVTKIMAQVRSGDGSRLIETMEITPVQKEGDEILAELTLKDLIEQKQEYVISIGLEMDGWQQAWYYTRAIWDPDSLIAEEMAFVMDFHKKLYFREEAKALVKYLESNSKLESNESFHKVNIHSSFKQITWGDLKVTETREPTVTLKEINGQNASIVLDYGVSTAGSERNVQYLVQEYYKIRYSADRTYLLGYERTMTQIPDEKALYAGDKFLLGIGDENVDMMENEDGSVLVFQQADRLFSYHVSDQKVILIFSFYDLENYDEREYLDQHDVKILGVDEDGNVDFATYGYLNRGEREGEVGIRICHYDAKMNVTSETAFIPWDEPYSSLKSQLSEMLYLSPERILYVYLKNCVYRLDLTDGSATKLMEVVSDGSMMASKDHQILAWQELSALGRSNEIIVSDLATGEKVTLKGEGGEALRLLGFMDHDVIYGVARTEQITKTEVGREFFPMYKLCIARADGTALKEYKQENLYVMGCVVEENQIILDRMQQKEDGSFVETTQDHVTKTQQAKKSKNKVSAVQIDVYEKYVQIQVSKKIDSKKVQLLTPKEVIREGGEDFVLEITSPVDCFTVYGPAGVEGKYVSVNNAVARADELSGTVVNEKGMIIWQKGVRTSRNQIMAIKEPAKVSVEESLAACLDVMLKQKGISVESAPLLEQGKYPLDILKENLTDASVYDLTGISLDAALYFVSKDLPVLATLKTGEAVLITGYNESQVVVFQPSTGKLTKRGMSDASKWLEESGNCFITFFPVIDF